MARPQSLPNVLFACLGILLGGLIVYTVMEPVQDQTRPYQIILTVPPATVNVVFPTPTRTPTATPPPTWPPTPTPFPSYDPAHATPGRIYQVPAPSPPPPPTPTPFPECTLTLVPGTLCIAPQTPPKTG